MEIKNTKGKEWDNWYDKQCKGKEREVKTAWKVMKRETMRREEANTALVRRNV